MRKQAVFVDLDLFSLKMKKQFKKFLRLKEHLNYF
jgi:hypothetical protein